MSASLVRKSLQIVDPQYDKTSKRKNKSDVFKLTPHNQKLLSKTYKKGRKEAKVNLLSTERKLTVSEARKNTKSKDQILKDNLKKLELIKKASKVHLDETIVQQIINRAVSRRPVKKIKPETDNKTAFTEEDFKKFEEEYFDE